MRARRRLRSDRDYRARARCRAVRSGRDDGARAVRIRWRIRTDRPDPTRRDDDDPPRYSQLPRRNLPAILGTFDDFFDLQNLARRRESARAQ